MDPFPASIPCGDGVGSRTGGEGVTRTGPGMRAASTGGVTIGPNVGPEGADNAGGAGEGGKGANTGRGGGGGICVSEH